MLPLGTSFPNSIFIDNNSFEMIPTNLFHARKFHFHLQSMKFISIKLSMLWMLEVDVKIVIMTITNEQCHKTNIQNLKLKK
jgi:hypothetical protein